MVRTVRSLRDRKNPQKRYLEKKRLKKLAREELQWLKCILRDGHFFRQTAINSIYGIPVFITGQPNYQLRCKSCSFVKRVENEEIKISEVPIRVDTMAQFNEMRMKQFGGNTLTKHGKRKKTPEEKVEKWKRKMLGMGK